MYEIEYKTNWYESNTFKAYFRKMASVTNFIQRQGIDMHDVKHIKFLSDTDYRKGNNNNM